MNYLRSTAERQRAARRPPASSPLPGESRPGLSPSSSLSPHSFFRVAGGSGGGLGGPDSSDRSTSTVTSAAASTRVSFARGLGTTLGQLHRAARSSGGISGSLGGALDRLRGSPVSDRASDEYKLRRWRLTGCPTGPDFCDRGGEIGAADDLGGEGRRPEPPATGSGQQWGLTDVRDGRDRGFSGPAGGPENPAEQHRAADTASVVEAELAEDGMLVGTRFLGGDTTPCVVWSALFPLWMAVVEACDFEVRSLFIQDLRDRHRAAALYPTVPLVAHPNGRFKVFHGQFSLRYWCEGVTFLRRFDNKFLVFGQIWSRTTGGSFMPSRGTARYPPSRGTARYL